MSEQKPKKSFLSRVFRALLDLNRWKKLFTHNFLLKVLSLLIAFGMWTFVNFGERDTEETLSVPLELNNIPSHLMISGPREDTIDLRVMGPRTLLGRIDRGRLTLALDLRGVRAGKAEFAIRAESVNLPRGVRITRVSPSRLHLDLEQVDRKRLSVELRYRGQLPGGLLIVSSSVSPKEVELIGPRSLVHSFDLAQTEMLEISTLGEGVLEKELVLEPLGEYLSFDHDRVVASVMVEAITVSRTVENISVAIAQPTELVLVEPQTVSVSLRGPMKIVEALQPEQIEVSVGAEAGAGVVPHVRLPERVELIAIDPPQVGVSPLHGAMAPVDEAS